MERSASVIWQGDLKQGIGYISTQSGALKSNPYGFNTRFENKPGTNPEELIAAAHASCFTMALTGKLDEAGMAAERLQTSATVTLEKINGAYTISAVHLVLMAHVPGANQLAFARVVEDTKLNCPVSKLLNAKITVETKLES